MWLAHRIQQTSRPAVSTETQPSSYHASQSPRSFNLSWLTTTPHCQTVSSESHAQGKRPSRHRKSAQTQKRARAQQPTLKQTDTRTSYYGARPIGTSRTRFNKALSIRPRPAGKPRPYKANLVPKKSPLRPHCFAQDRLALWKPAAARSVLDQNGRHIPLSDDDLQRILDIMVRAYMPGTLTGFGTGLLIWHVFCDQKGIREEQRAPAPQTLVHSFVATLTGAYSGSAITNYVYGVRAWHILHGIRWDINEDEMATILRAAEREAPPSARRKKRLPYTEEFLTRIREHLDLESPLDAAAWACVTTGFYSLARVGELTTRTLTCFDPNIHVKRCDRRIEADRNGLEQTIFFIPRTKCAPNGEDIYWAVQNGPTDPAAALENHLRVNPAQDDARTPLFAYRHQGAPKLRPLTKHALITRLASAARAADLDPLQGHGIRIGGTLEYLLRGKPFDAVRTIGRWKSDAFLIYLRKHAQIMAPYMQANPTLQAEFVRVTMPPVR
ncbi:DNA breaking-rejoining enzyme [Obba rivulosa]|uniref:DNA breaking-rejoining enzyme n=1 Tax=Obba rivulosa TaxID=1052685 RepID=A0A8E2ASP6_9APHY|nr:DNA breaking-rejoining enzyme [Obba rivulosa]